MLPPLYWPPEGPPVFNVRHVRNQIVKCVLPTNGLIRDAHYVVTLCVAPIMGGERPLYEYWPWRFCDAYLAKVT